MNMNQVAILAQATRASQMEYESLEAFLKDRQLDHATDATHRFEALSDGIEVTAQAAVLRTALFGNWVAPQHPAVPEPVKCPAS